MEITKYDPILEKNVTLDLPITQEQYDKWQNGELIQKAMPNLTPIQREFLISGISTDDGWDSLFGENDNVGEENDDDFFDDDSEEEED